MNENYIMLNGKRVDLTDEQLEKLGLKVNKDCFNRSSVKEEYFFIDTFGKVSYDYNDSPVGTDRVRHKVANYCTNKSIMKQRALHETLDRLLWRFSVQNGGDKIDWSNHNTDKCCLYFSHKEKTIVIENNNYLQNIGCTYFNTREVAERAINEIVIPFIKEHPEFVW